MSDNRESINREEDTAECATPRCPRCGSMTRPEHAHNKCDTCGYIVPCCEPGSGG